LQRKRRSRGRSKEGGKKRKKEKREVAVEGMKKQWWGRIRMRKRK